MKSFLVLSSFGKNLRWRRRMINYLQTYLRRTLTWKSWSVYLFHIQTINTLLTINSPFCTHDPLTDDLFSDKNGALMNSCNANGGHHLIRDIFICQKKRYSGLPKNFMHKYSSVKDTDCVSQLNISFSYTGQYKKDENN